MNSHQCMKCNQESIINDSDVQNGMVFCCSCANRLINQFSMREVELLLSSLKDMDEDKTRLWTKVLEAHGEDEKAIRERYVNEIGQHEAMDRSFMLQEMVEGYLVEHPYIILDEKSFRLATMASLMLASLYQSVGSGLTDKEG